MCLSYLQEFFFKQNTKKNRRTRLLTCLGMNQHHKRKRQQAGQRKRTPYHSHISLSLSWSTALPKSGLLNCEESSPLLFDIIYNKVMVQAANWLGEVLRTKTKRRLAFYRVDSWPLVAYTAWERESVQPGSQLCMHFFFFSVEEINYKEQAQPPN